MSDQAVQGKVNARLNADKFREQVNSLEKRRDQRLAELALERESGNSPEDVSKDNLGYDIESITQAGFLRFIEVKGRSVGHNDVTITHNEMKTASNSPDKCILAVVIVYGNKRNVIL
jgi:hypothetical protein